MTPRSMRGCHFALALSLVAAAAPRASAQPAGKEPIDIGMPSDDAKPDEPAEAPPVRDPAAAKKLADGAAKLAKKGDKLARRKKNAEAAADWDRAVLAYDKSFELQPDPKVLVAAASLELRLGRYLAADTHLGRALAATEVPLAEKARAAAQAMRDEARLHLGVVSLSISPEGATVTLDERELGVAPLAEPLVLEPGTYQLRIVLEGYVALRQKLVVDAGSESERRLELQPVPVVVAPPRPPPPQPPPPLPPAPAKTALYVGGGAAVLFTAGAVATGVLAIGAHGTFTDPMATDDERDTAQSSGRTYALLSDVCTGLAVVAAGFTAYYYVAVYRPKVSERERLERDRAGMHDEYAGRPPIIVAPAVGADGGGLVISGWF